MKSLLQWKFIVILGIPVKFPWLPSAKPVFNFSDGTIRINNPARQLIGVKSKHIKQHL